MKPDLKIRLTKQLIQPRKTKGFTLIELLIVVIIVGILAAIGTPTLFTQIGKAREAEAKNNLGILSRAQQGYHLEKQSFYNGDQLKNFADVQIVGSYYIFTPDETANSSKATHTAYNREPGSYKGRDFASGVYFDGVGYSQILCVADSIDDNPRIKSVVTADENGNCIGGEEIR